MDERDTLKKYLDKLGIDPEATELYLLLAKRGHSSALQLSKLSGISRTQVYRHLDELKNISLISAEQLSYGTLYRALPLDNLEGLLANREAETAAIRRNLGGMAAFVQKLAGSDAKIAAVRHYYGVAGLKQANWNLLKADKEYRVFEAAPLNFHLDRAFSRKHREKCIELGLISYDLTNATELKLKDLEPRDPERSFNRYIDPKILTIDFEIYVYNQRVALLDYRQGHEMAIEIDHPILHTMMRQLFDAMWAQATPLEITR